MRGAVFFLLSMLLATPALAQSAFLDSERARLRAHFDDVIAELETADTSALSVEQRARRAEHLVRLAEYRDRGVFPQRYGGPPGRVPEFRDVHGTRCAMGELIYLSGETQLVDDVATTANSATIAELSADPRLTRWLSENGLTVGEAGRVQPSYIAPPGACLCAYTNVALFRAVSNDAATASTNAEGFHVVEVELLEHLAGPDARVAGQHESVPVRFAAPQGRSLLVAFSETSAMAFPIHDGSATVACSTESTALSAYAGGTICRADTPIALDVAVEAMLLDANECFAAFYREDEALTRSCLDDGIVDAGVEDMGIGDSGVADSGIDGRDHRACMAGLAGSKRLPWVAVLGALSVFAVRRRQRLRVGDE